MIISGELEEYDIVCDLIPCLRASSGSVGAFIVIATYCR